MPNNRIAEILKFDPLASQEKKPTSPSNTIKDILKFDPVKEEKVSGEKELQEPESNATWSQTLVDAFQNIPSSAWETGKSMIEPIIHPIQTGKAIGRLAAGAAQKITPGKGEYEADFDAVVDFYKRRYGGIEEFKKSLAKDPVGVLADAAMLFTGAGTAARGVGMAGKIGQLSQAGKMITKAGAAMEPLNVARRIAALPLKLLPEKIPINMYQSAVKFGTTLSAKERIAVTKTALRAENQIMPTAQGMEKLRSMIDSYNENINKIINQSAQRGTQIDVNRVYAGLDNIKHQLLRTTDKPLIVDRAFKEMKREWKRNLEVGELRTPIEVQKIKTTIYKDLESFYEQHKASPASVKLRKAVARNAREILEEIIPEIKMLNRKEGALIDLWDAVESKANRISNRDLIGIGIPVKMGTGAGVGYMFAGQTGGEVGTALGFALGIYDTPSVKSRIALVANRLREKGITVRPSTAALRLGLFEAGQMELGEKRD